MTPKLEIHYDQHIFLRDALNTSGERLAQANVFLVTRSDRQQDIVVLAEGEVIGSPEVIGDVQTLLTKYQELKNGFGLPPNTDVKQDDLLEGISKTTKLRDLFPDFDTGTLNALARKQITTWGELKKSVKSKPDTRGIFVTSIERIGKKRSAEILSALNKLKNTE
ncbi:hypothetical protein A2363_02030 [Candidatus Gottesmanbacteria bacterium RIFOXYB1_FULL_47_11]|uniref:Uncharacterized protein n=1 Tax=Candidatus Gottesmanbacteria bacterium RIFOXYB1_FULL_47_11 TaxID=1798401 RepID=A0A1F6BEN0_9BACT|nr:MAG: hypothetical protein A2363_02030 [Candidatus Gottesmanbacteria bacterium RIFOXYB1_FULL_47_11]